MFFCDICCPIPYFTSTRSTLTLYAGAVYEKLLPVLICEVMGVTALGVSGELLAVAEPESTVAVPVPWTPTKGSSNDISSVVMPALAILITEYEHRHNWQKNRPFRHLDDNRVGGCITRDTPVECAILRQGAWEIFCSTVDTKELQHIFEDEVLLRYQIPVPVVYRSWLMGTHAMHWGDMNLMHIFDCCERLTQRK